MIDWTKLTAVIVCSAIISVVSWLLLRNAKAQGKTEQALRDQLAGAKVAVEIADKSNESVEAVTARIDTGLHDVPDIVRGDTLPDWLKR